MHVSTHCAWWFASSMQVCTLPFIGGQVLPEQGSSTQKLFASHFLPTGHGNSPVPHGNSQRQSDAHVEPPLHEPACGLPLQSQHDAGSTGVPTHVTMPLTHLFWPLQMPGAVQPHAAGGLDWFVGSSQVQSSSTWPSQSSSILSHVKSLPEVVELQNNVPHWCW